MADGRGGGGYVSVPAPQASWVPTAPVPRSLQLATDGGGEDITISWRNSRLGERILAFLILTTLSVFCFMGSGAGLTAIVATVTGFDFNDTAVVVYPCWAVLAYGGVLLYFRDFIWPPCHTLTVTSEAVQYSVRSYSPGCLLAVAAGLGGDGARTVTETVSHARVSELSTKAPSGGGQGHIHEIMLKSSDGGIIQLKQYDMKKQHWLHMLLQNWRNSGSGGGRGGGAALAFASPQ